ncbi:polysaccharide deacetylase family protein [Ruegeria atlantica]|uniref:polysaccharide deacetylase family protein n=1 Tax=Ruegeria atlantica TaxID=81569 RepID=UPI00147A7CD6|nr:polysaccharide deacetylase family protein [Ruegeria atlantica]
MELQRALKAILELNDRVRIELENADIAAERSGTSLVDPHYWELEAMKGDISVLLNKVRWMTPYENDQPTIEENVKIEQLRKFLEANALIPHIETSIRTLVEEPLQNLEPPSLPKGPSFEAKSVTRKAIREPSSGAIGNITGSSIPDGNWMLTYDDGPHPTNTEKVRGILGSYSAPATFFCYVEPAEKYPSVLKKTVAEGYEIGSHSWTHPFLTRVSDTRLKWEVFEATDELEAIANVSIRLFRCPYGDGASNRTRERVVISRRRLIHAFWNVDSKDWADSDENSVLKRVERQMSRVGGGIILFHDIHDVTPKVTKLFLEKYSANQSFGSFDDYYTLGTPIIS